MNQDTVTRLKKRATKLFEKQHHGGHSTHAEQKVSAAIQLGKVTPFVIKKKKSYLSVLESQMKKLAPDFRLPAVYINPVTIDNVIEFKKERMLKWKQIALIEASNGASVTEIIGVLGISKVRHAEMLKDVDQEYARFIAECKEHSKRWWYRTGRLGLMLKGFNTPLYQFQMKNRYKWADKVEIDPGNGDISNIQDEIKKIAKGEVEEALGKSSKVESMTPGVKIITNSQDEHVDDIADSEEAI